MAVEAPQAGFGANRSVAPVSSPEPNDPGAAPGPLHPDLRPEAAPSLLNLRTTGSGQGPPLALVLSRHTG